MHLTPERAVRGRVIEVLDHHDARRTDRSHIRVEGLVPDSRPIRTGRAARDYRRGGGKSDHPAELREHAPDPAVGKAHVARLQVERLDRVGKRRSVIASEGLEQLLHPISLCDLLRVGDAVADPWGVWITSGGPSLRLSRPMVTLTVLVNGVYSPAFLQTVRVCRPASHGALTGAKVRAVLDSAGG